jgi:hypothetical protein
MAICDPRSQNQCQASLFQTTGASFGVTIALDNGRWYNGAQIT